MSLLRPFFAFLLFTRCGIGPLRAADEAGGARARKENSLIEEPEVALRKFTVAPGLVTLKTSGIKLRQRGLSAMPEDMVTYITKRELRDLLEFLATAK